MEDILDHYCIEMFEWYMISNRPHICPKHRIICFGASDKFKQMSFIDLLQFWKIRRIIIEVLLLSPGRVVVGLFIIEWQGRINLTQVFDNVKSPFILKNLV